MPIEAMTVFARPSLGAVDDPYVILLRCGTDLDLRVECRARAELVHTCREPRSARWIVVFVGRRRFVDARGLDVLLDAAAAAEDRARTLLVVDPPRSLERMVNVLGLTDRLTLADSAWTAAGVIGAGHLDEHRSRLMAWSS